MVSHTVTALLDWRSLVGLGSLMAVLAVVAVLLQAVLIHLLNKKIPSAYVQREAGERIVSQRSFKNVSEVKVELERFFGWVGSEINQAIRLCAILTVVIFFLFQGFFYVTPLPPPKPGPLAVPFYVISTVLTLLVTSFGWIKVILERAQTRLLRQEIIDKYIILGVFKPGS